MNSQADETHIHCSRTHQCGEYSFSVSIIFINSSSSFYTIDYRFILVNKKSV